MDLLARFGAGLYGRRLTRLERRIGCKLICHDIPDRYINGMVIGSMTATWKKFGLDIVEGVNHWTIGCVINGLSTRFDRSAPEYQSWLGGYTVRLASEKMITVQDHFKLAIADQNAWLRWYGDPEPMTNIEGWQPFEVGGITLGRYQGRVYEFGCTTHSDVGSPPTITAGRFAASEAIAVLFKFSNPHLALKGKYFMPPSLTNQGPYERLDLRGYIAIFNVAPYIKTVLYANGAVVVHGSSAVDNFQILKNDFLRTMRSWEIIEV